MATIGHPRSLDNVMDSNRLLLLRVFFAGGEAEALLDYGLTYSQIARLLVDAREDGLILETEEGSKISEQAVLIIRSNADGSLRRDGGWISPEESSRTEKLGIEEVFLPMPRHARFKT